MWQLEHHTNSGYLEVRGTPELKQEEISVNAGEPMMENDDMHSPTYAFPPPARAFKDGIETYMQPLEKFV